MTKPKVLGIIPARGGSKGLKRKNIAPLGGKPLITWSIEAGLTSRYITTTLVSSEDSEILAIAKKYNAETLIRPEALAQDSTLSEPVIAHVLAQLEAGQYEYLVLLQPTSPLRTSDDIDKAFELLLNSDADALISVYEPSHHPLKAFNTSQEGYLQGLVNDTYPFMRRQDLPKAYYPNGAIYIIKVATFLKTQKLFTPKTLPYLMSEIHSIDIDTQADLDTINTLLQKDIRARH